MTREEYLEHFRHRVIQDALAEAEAATWHRRAAMFEWAKPSLGDFHGKAGKDKLSIAWRRCDAVAQACRNRAAVAEMAYRDRVEAENCAGEEPNLQDVIWRLMWEQRLDAQDQGDLAVNERFAAEFEGLEPRTARDVVNGALFLAGDDPVTAEHVRRARVDVCEQVAEPVTDRRLRIVRDGGAA